MLAMSKILLKQAFFHTIFILKNAEKLSCKCIKKAAHSVSQLGFLSNFPH